MMSATHKVNAQAAIATVERLKPGHYRATQVSGGSIHHCFHISDGQTSFFAKVACEPKAQQILQAEAEGLRAIAATGTIRTPEVLLLKQINATDNRSAKADTDSNGHECCCMVLEFLDITDTKAGAPLGHALAALHHCHGEYFGWSSDNFIGTTTQPNTSHSEVTSFMAHQRIGHQLKLAQRDGLNFKILDLAWKLVERIPELYLNYHPKPSLLHGDLWHGNQASLEDGTPVVFDPAVYYGDPEADLAMAELFGGFDSAFFAAYREHNVIDQGYSLRKNLHQLYHILNHHHLFGSSYAGHAQRLVQSMLAALK